jgi:RNA polymerase sigma-70 factor (ECF subfamily)
MARGDEAGAIAEAVARRSYGKLVADHAARTRDVAAAEDALAEAFATALTDWSANGAPVNPEAWLLTVARRKSIDHDRRKGLDEAASERLRMTAEEIAANVESPTDIPDERLALMFACAHPAIDGVVRAPMILQTILGFDAATIASAFLVAPATMGQRLSRAKSRIKLAGIPFRAPDRDDMRERLEAVLDAIYAAFTEGWIDPTGADAQRRNLADEAIWLGRLIVSLLPTEPEALGLLSLMLHAEARRSARRNAEGDFVPLDEQDSSSWNGDMIDEAEALLSRAATMKVFGRYQLEAAVQSAHAARRRAGRSDWNAILQLYHALFGITGSPVVAINRAIALAEVEDAAAGLGALDAIKDARLADYQPFWAARAALLARTGDREAAASAYQRAIGLEADPAVRRFLQRKRAGLIETN